MATVCWLFQHVGAATLDRDHFDQLAQEMGIGQATLRLNPFAQWTMEPPNPDFHGHSPFVNIPGTRSAPGSQDGRTTHAMAEGAEAALDALWQLSLIHI